MLELLAILIIAFTIYGLSYYKESVTVLSGMLIIILSILIGVLLIAFKKMMKS